jgi:hypothetical protein
MMIGNIMSFYGSFSATIACIWLSIWAIRRKAEIDYPLDRSARIVRWAIVAAGFVVGYYVPGPGLAYVRVAGGFVGLAFLCWPNFAYHLTKLFKHGSTSPDSQQ